MKAPLYMLCGYLITQSTVFVYLADEPSFMVDIRRLLLKSIQWDVAFRSAMVDHGTYLFSGAQHLQRFLFMKPSSSKLPQMDSHPSIGINFLPLGPGNLANHPMKDLMSKKNRLWVTIMPDAVQARCLLPQAPSEARYPPPCPSRPQLRPLSKTPKSPQ